MMISRSPSMDELPHQMGVVAIESATNKQNLHAIFQKFYDQRKETAPFSGILATLLWMWKKISPSQAQDVLDPTQGSYQDKVDALSQKVAAALDVHFDLFDLREEDSALVTQKMPLLMAYTLWAFQRENVTPFSMDQKYGRYNLILHDKEEALKVSNFPLKFYPLDLAGHFLGPQMVFVYKGGPYAFGKGAIHHITQGVHLDTNAIVLRRLQGKEISDRTEEAIQEVVEGDVQAALGTFGMKNFVTCYGEMRYISHQKVKSVIGWEPFGKSLTEALEEDHLSWTWEKRRQIARSLIFEMETMHRTNRFHGDIKSANIVIDEESCQIKFIDPESMDGRFDRTTYACCPLETRYHYWRYFQIHEADRPEPKFDVRDSIMNDIWGMGLVLFELFAATTTYQTAHADWWTICEDWMNSRMKEDFQGEAPSVEYLREMQQKMFDQIDVIFAQLPSGPENGAWKTIVKNATRITPYARRLPTLTSLKYRFSSDWRILENYLEQKSLTVGEKIVLLNKLAYHVRVRFQRDDFHGSINPETVILRHDSLDLRLIDAGLNTDARYRPLETLWAGSQGRSDREYREKGDLWSLGLTCWAILTPQSSDLKKCLEFFSNPSSAHIILDQAVFTAGIHHALKDLQGAMGWTQKITDMIQFTACRRREPW